MKTSQGRLGNEQGRFGLSFGHPNKQNVSRLIQRWFAQSPNSESLNIIAGHDQSALWNLIWNWCEREMIFTKNIPAFLFRLKTTALRIQLNFHICFNTGSICWAISQMAAVVAFSQFGLISNKVLCYGTSAIFTWNQYGFETLYFQVLRWTLNSPALASTSFSQDLGIYF